MPRRALLASGLWLALWVGLAAASARAEGSASFTRQPVDPYTVARGPVELRDEWMLAQPRLTLPATTPDALPCGVTEVGVHLDWGNDFGFNQRGPAESPFADVRFLVDGEHRTLAFTARRGLGAGFDVALRLPVQWRGAGILDPLIDAFHEITGTMDNDRPEFDQNRYRIQGRDHRGNAFDWNDEHGTGLGNAEVALRWAFLRPRDGCGLRAALVARLGLPTGTGPFRTDSVDAGLQLALAQRIHRRWDLYGGVGGSWYSHTDIRGFEYEPWRAYGYFAVEFRFARRWSLILQTDASSRLISNLVNYPSYQWYAALGAKADLGRNTRFFVGFTENIVDQQSTADVCGWIGLEKRF